MAQEPKVATTEMTSIDAARLMASYDFGVVPVVDRERRLVGLVTDRDIVLRVVASGEDPGNVQLGQIATDKNLVTIEPDATVDEARQRMQEHRIKRLPVVEGEQLVGVIALGDVAVTSGSTADVGETVKEISRSPATEEVEGAAPVDSPPAQVGRAPAGGDGASSEGGM
jgi:signal-transduction protein with cAMP-binding, CBS, and nucleotidyltransferase domain